GVPARKTDDRIRAARAEGPAVLAGFRMEAQTDVDAAAVLRAQLLGKRLRQCSAGDDATIYARHDEAAAAIRLMQQRATAEDTEQQTGRDRCPFGPRPLASRLLGFRCGFLRRSQQSVRHRLIEHAGECTAD